MKNNLQENQKGSLTTVSTSLSLQSSKIEIKRKVLLISKSFKTAYPHIFSSIFTNKDDFKNWCKIWGSIVSDLDEESVKLAIKSTISLCEYPPSPSYFRKKALRITDARTAFEYIIQKKPFTNKYSEEAWNSIDSYDRKTFSLDDLFRRFQSRYDNICENALIIR